MLKIVTKHTGPGHDFLYFLDVKDIHMIPPCVRSYERIGRKEILKRMLKGLEADFRMARKSFDISRIAAKKKDNLFSKYDKFRTKEFLGQQKAILKWHKKVKQELNKL